MKVTRREFLKGSLMTSAVVVAGGAGALVAPRTAGAAANSPRLAKWIQPLRGLGPTGIPVLTAVNPDPLFGAGTNFYQVTASEFLDQLHPSLPPTTLWGYRDTLTSAGAQRHLGGVIVAARGTASRIRFTNTLPSTSIIPVDTTIAGANQARNRIAVHLHGGFVPWISDGGPFDWWTPGGPGYTQGLSFLNGPGSLFNTPAMVDGQADYFYPNDQSTRLMWYHDHAHGITRTNAYSGLATGYLLLDPINDALRSFLSGRILSPITSPAQVLPLVWQDKIFVSSTTRSTDPTWSRVAPARVQGVGSLWYEHVYNPRLFALAAGASARNLPNPSAIPEFFGDTMLCNGTVYPLLTVEAKRYRFFMLNACNARFLNINTFVAAGADGITLNTRTQFPTNAKGPDIIQIGTEGGLLYKEVIHVGPKPFNPLTMTGNLILGPAERADVIIDFSGLAGKDFILYNDAPGPFPAGPPANDYYLGNRLNPIKTTAGFGPDTRQILRIRVVAATAADAQQFPILNADPALLDPPLLVDPGSYTTVVPPLPDPAGAAVRVLTLNEDFDLKGRLRQLLGTDTIGPGGGYGREYLDPATENVTAGATEVWQIFNLSADTHPVHFHLVNVQVLWRRPFNALAVPPLPPTWTGPARGPELNEVGWKETVQMHPGECTTVAMRFDLPTGLPFTVPDSPRFPAAPGTTTHEYVWHCHILEHEEHDMMRPLVVTSTP